MTVTASPHVRAPGSVKRVMWAVVIAMLPAFAGSVWFFGWRALMLVGLAIADQRDQVGEGHLAVIETHMEAVAAKLGTQPVRLRLTDLERDASRMIPRPFCFW